MRLEDLMFVDGWTWYNKVVPISIEPGEEKSVLTLDKNKGFLFGAVSAFYGSSDAKYAYMTINIDDSLIYPLYPYGLSLLGLNKWTPYGTMLLDYDTIKNNYIVAEVPDQLIPFRNKLSISVGLPKKVETWFGTHVNTNNVNAYIAYLIVAITDFNRFRDSYVKLFRK